MLPELDDRTSGADPTSLGALGSSERFRLLEFEDVILDREAIWPERDGTLTDLGWGFLGEIKKHVRRRVDTLMHCEKHLSCDDFIVFVAALDSGPTTTTSVGTAI
ncbi:hypothetical protein GCM10027074_34420 [Streptomyces deserti]